MTMVPNSFYIGPSTGITKLNIPYLGRVTGETLFNMLKLEEGEIGDDERPIYPHKIISAEIYPIHFLILYQGKG
uniref:Peptidyl-prolyl cis-trans isomerase cwc27-like protein n=1 Tax=Triatoma infestans TaxID=30076 RepID=A0A170VUK2_TRIIF